MREDRRRRYDDGFRREALELIKSGAGKDTLARRLAIPVYTARNWIGLYRSNGEEAVMGGGGSRRYDWETKVAYLKAKVAYLENSGPCGRPSHAARAKRRRPTARRAGTPARPPPEDSRAAEIHVLPPPVAPGARVQAGRGADGTGDMGWQYQHQWWRDELERPGIRRSMSRKGNCLDNAAAEQVFGHLKDEFYRGRVFDSYEQFKRELDAYIIHWNTRRRQIRLEGRTPEEFRSMSLAV